MLITEGKDFLLLLSRHVENIYCCFAFFAHTCLKWYFIIIKAEEKLYSHRSNVPCEPG